MRRFQTVSSATFEGTWIYTCEHNHHIAHESHEGEIVQQRHFLSSVDIKSTDHTNPNIMFTKCSPQFRLRFQVISAQSYWRRSLELQNHRPCICAHSWQLNRLAFHGKHLIGFLVRTSWGIKKSIVPLLCELCVRLHTILSSIHLDEI